MPKPDYVDALAAAMAARPIDYYPRTGRMGVTGMHNRARSLYAALTTEPVVQDAVLAALVEGGRLVEEAVGSPEWDKCPGQSCEMGGLPLPEGDPWPTHNHGPARWVRKVRLVEPEWREAAP